MSDREGRHSRHSAMNRQSDAEPAQPLQWVSAALVAADRRAALEP